MPLKNIAGKNDVYYMAAMISNFILVISIVFLIFYFIAPLFGGRLLVLAIIRYSASLGMALALKIILTRLQKEVQIGKKEYLLIWFVTIINLIVWLTYPLNLALSIVATSALIFSYKRK